MGIVLINLLILFGVIALVEIPKHFIKSKNTKLVSFISYLLMGIFAFLVGEYVLFDFSNFAYTLAISFIIVAFISLISNNKTSND
ncbi:hypothetical protein BAZO_16124 [Schinkia azotoformans LMG 9581]|uniref:Uncharacterized protein n=1 Tax=Schinkia azotoformans LMG 9581 TaxID=1131731 RepID=K6DSI2_SCHAZ|nr:hypothetical protein BAZO_16124 [Schinkia azotoformans LMG 9581]